jgi:dynactin 1
MDPKLGTIVEIRIKVNDALTLQRGVLRFWGATDFATGKWAGIELSLPHGKNNGTVQGIKYFTCPPNHGVFVKPSQVNVVQERESVPTPPPARAAPSPAPAPATPPGKVCQTGP